MAWDRKILRRIYGPPSGNGYWVIKIYGPPSGNGYWIIKIYGPPSRNGYWIIKVNQNIYNTFISSDIVTVIEVSRSEWVGHVAGMDGGRTVMKLLKTIPGGETKEWKPRVR